MRSAASVRLPILFLLAAVSSTQAYDFFYFVLQWPGSYCDTKQSCCYPTSGKPEVDFGIHGLWPNNNDGSYPSNCDSRKPFDESKVRGLLSSLHSEWPTLACPSNDGTNFWAHEWEKHGTCAESVFDEYRYFKTALDLKTQLNLLQSLQSAGIQPDGGSYSLMSIKNAIEESVGYAPYIECNGDKSGNSQLYQVYLCVDSSGSQLIECPIFPRGKCGSQIEFPSF
ncbi:extracellular ribonuclease LE-like [Carex rostrata]